MNGFSPATHLLLVIATPLIGAVVAWVLGGRGLSAVRQSAAVTALITLVNAGWLVLRYLQSPEAAAGAPYAVSSAPWLVGGILMCVCRWDSMASRSGSSACRPCFH